MADIIRNGDFSRKQRIDLIKRCLLISGVNLIDEKQLDNSFHRFNVCLDGKEFSLDLLLKNISNSGWSDKPLIKRIQVRALPVDEIEKNTVRGCSIFIGVAYANESPILVAWNPFMFLYHNTNRSCYIDVKLLASCQHEGFLKATSSNQKVILADTSHFLELIEEYRRQNTIQEL